MCDVLHQKFNNSEPPGQDQKYEKGQACAAFYEKDRQWHRATLLETEPTRAQVTVPIIMWSFIIPPLKKCGGYCFAHVGRSVDKPCPINN